MSRVLSALLLAAHVAYGGPETKTLYITEADSGTVQMVDLDVPGLPLFSHQS